MKVLVACEYSGRVREAFRARGHDAWSCDLLEAEDGSEFHHQKDVSEMLWYHQWDIVIAHPPCTYITNSGVRWLYLPNGEHNEARWLKLEEAVEFFGMFQRYKDRNKDVKLCIENPIPHKYAKQVIGPYHQLIQPYQFGHTTSKATCLWLYRLPKLQPTKIIPKEERTFDIHKAPPSPDRWKDRSRTFQGIANAMAEQWG